MSAQRGDFGRHTPDTVEKAARALWGTVDDWPWEKASPEAQAYARRQALAVLSVVPPTPDDGLRDRVLALADAWERDYTEGGLGDSRGLWVAEGIRAAVAGDPR